MDADGLAAEVLDHVLAHRSRHTCYLHEVEIEEALRVLDAADADMLAVDKGQDVEFFSAGVLLAGLFELEPAERDVHLGILSEDELLPAFAFAVKPWLLDYVFRALGVVDYAVAAVLTDVELSKLCVDGALLAVEVEPQVIFPSGEPTDHTHSP